MDLNALLVALWLMAAGVTQPGGAGTTIHYYDDTASASGTGYTFAEISAAFPADFVDVSAGGRESYASAVRLQCGDTTVNAATTTLNATNADVSFAPGFRWQWRATQTSSWFTNLGTKVGSGNRAGAKNGCNITHGAGIAFNPLGTFKAYDCKFIMNGTQALTLQPITGSGSEMVECTLVNTSTGNFSIGSPSFLFDNLFNVEICGVAATMVSAIGSAAQERITISATAPTAYAATTVANLQFKDFAFKGTPSTSDFRWTNVGATNWVVVQPKWSQNGPKFAQAAAGSMAVANGAKEYWLYNIKVVGATGAAIANIPVTLTDALGNVQVNTTTDANGRVSFGSGLTANMVLVMDHYTVSQVYTQRHRSPFLVEINAGSSRNVSYGSYRYNLYWPGYEGITTSAGTFEDVNDIVPLEFAAGALTSWIERVAPS